MTIFRLSIRRLFTVTLLLACLSINVTGSATNITVSNASELATANKNAQPGDIITLRNGEWKDISIRLDARGTKEKPITFRAATAGAVTICGKSSLKLGGSWLIVDGLYFTKGYAGEDEVIDFRVDKKTFASNCRVTNCVINDFNNPRRMDENYWVGFYGRNNRLDHNTFIDKKNMGVLLAVMLEDPESRENYHSIDHNHFARRPALASNSGEIIRVGVSQTSHFNSNTRITDNYFEHCDGETEIISIKSSSNIISGNYFRECQGGLVLRHGDFNTVENNVFYGNNKRGTGGVRIINKGQWVINNLFYECRGIDFRSPLSLMNGVPNSPAFRYVQVTDAVVANNTFYNCSSISFCEGSDAERTATPDNVHFINNVFANNRDSAVYTAFDKLDGFRFNGNELSRSVTQPVSRGFTKTDFSQQSLGRQLLPVSRTKSGTVGDSIQQVAYTRLKHNLATAPGFRDLKLWKDVVANAASASGARWFSKIAAPKTHRPETVNCSTVSEIEAALSSGSPVHIRLTGESYNLKNPLIITKEVRISGQGKKEIRFSSSPVQSLFVVGGMGRLTLESISFNGSGVRAGNLVSNDSSGPSNHYNVVFRNNTVTGFDRANGCDAIFRAYKSSVADSLVFTGNSFENNNTNGLMMADEITNKGYYAAESIAVNDNKFWGQTGILLSVYRGGNDESTMGPSLTFNHNKLLDCKTVTADTLIRLVGVQNSQIMHNKISNCNAGGVLLSWHDIVRARHWFADNKIEQSGVIRKNLFVADNRNLIK